MPDAQVSPISQLLHTLGITREDLNKRSDQMRQFLTAESDASSSRVSERDTANRSMSGSDIRSLSRASTSTSSFTRSLSRARSDSLHDTSPPATPIKTEPHESSGTSLRHYDSMEMVIERQRQSRREKKSRRGKERDSTSRTHMPHPPSPSPSNASQSSHGRDYYIHPRDDRRVSSAGIDEASSGASSEKSAHPPITPQKNKYYREHTLFSGTSQPRKETTCKVETSTPTRPSVQLTPQTQPMPQYFGSYSAYGQYLPPAYKPAQAGSSAPPVTPQIQRIQASAKKSAAMSSPLPPSSPPSASSPFSSPMRPAVNLVSSPGPMGPLPTEEDYDSLPYTLPPGPYSPNKPDLSYAALVGQAILSSPEHRLTLQEIYDWITIVFPHYKRGETTWMNSIRHVLSTTVCFRKVPRERSVGRTLWAIFDEDLECFKGGGFRKQLCKDIANGNDGKDRQASGSKGGKSRARKRADDDDGAADSRKTKKSKKEQLASAKTPMPGMASSSYSMAPTLGSHPLFPPTRPTPHHQPYYESCLPQAQHPLPAEIIFPPLPTSAAFTKVVAPAAAAAASHSAPSVSAANEQDNAPSSSPLTDRSVPPFGSASVPALTPNRSSSPPSSLPSTSDMDIDVRAISSKEHNTTASVTISRPDDDLDLSSASGETEDGDDVFNTTLLGPVKFWGESPKAAGGLQPGIQLMDPTDSDEDVPGKKDLKGKKKQKGLNFPPMPSSPTLGRRNAPSKVAEASLEPRRPTTPTSAASNAMMPSTPPRKIQELPISSVRTPISHKGLHMSPSASLAHYKSNLDPPPVLSFNPSQSQLEHSAEARGENGAVDPLRTPRKRTASGGTTSAHHPVTPRKLVFHANASDSPFRTPVGGGSGSSPFRTPRSRAIFDPHDPRNLLNDELSRMGEGYGYGDSPGGLFGKSRESLLYDSPGMGSPGKWQRWW